MYREAGSCSPNDRLPRRRSRQSRCERGSRRAGARTRRPSCTGPACSVGWWTGRPPSGPTASSRSVGPRTGRRSSMFAAGCLRRCRSTWGVSVVNREPLGCSSASVRATEKQAKWITTRRRVDDARTRNDCYEERNSKKERQILCLPRPWSAIYRRRDEPTPCDAGAGSGGACTWSRWRWARRRKRCRPPPEWKRPPCSWGRAWPASSRRARTAAHRRAWSSARPSLPWIRLRTCRNDALPCASNAL